MRFFRNNQKKLRIDLYKGLLDAIHNSSTGKDIGKAFILPSSHPGSPRQMFELYQDAMSIVAHYGKFLLINFNSFFIHL